jgi:hypothetical protein
MEQKQMMTIHEKLAVLKKAREYRQAGNKAEADRITLELPMPPYIAELFKDCLGADFLIKGGYNLSEAEAEFGPDWLAQ